MRRQSQPAAITLTDQNSFAILDDDVGLVPTKGDISEIFNLGLLPKIAKVIPQIYIPAAKRKLGSGCMSLLNALGCPHLLEVCVEIGPKVVACMIDSSAMHSFVRKSVLINLDTQDLQVLPLWITLGSRLEIISSEEVELPLIFSDGLNCKV